ncbi:MAG TPA: hypothetical protein VGP18_06230 [Solirubrobacteraceae bacterium]|nr:hypothetical protein [Solirubrobacteraceae bacterium]
MIALSDNEPAPTDIALSGTGVAANSGPNGPTGSSGPTGPTGAAGTNGTQGPAGMNGADGASGPAGSQGSAGLQGPVGQIELVTCQSITTGKDKNKKTIERCTTKLTSSPVVIARTSVTAVLSRGRVIYATGSVVGPGKNTKLLLTPRHSIGNGSYTLTLTHGRKRQHKTIMIQ